MRPPRFWNGDIDPRSREAAPLTRVLLTPLAALYAGVTARKIRQADPAQLPIPVICVGNLTAGGSGKSPVAAGLRDWFSERFPGKRIATLSRGYKGRLKGPLRVDFDTHTAADVGDEALMFAAHGEAWIGADRGEAGKAMAADGVDLIIMDDGHQNPTLKKDLSLVVVDSEYGFGNGHVIPRGPLREPIDRGLERADAVIVTGRTSAPEELNSFREPILRCLINSEGPVMMQALVAFAGIGRPEKFFDTLGALGNKPVDAVPFPDHHAYTRRDLAYLHDLARKNGATLITTEKDFVRLDQEQRKGILTLPVKAQFDAPQMLDQILAPVAERLSS
ncbi:tetraacyldisaccharide 4'-kinase [Henriciella aquimarina]|uniref:tetraacyldisaccharide 4'-kinase n=1 Tax=Henriciella aquimarina TaxID=545261 RepID=UPI000A06DF5E|nr:tetraacyldisaccharide 4'-kinase [Henriciella aquimarina]